MMVSALNHVAFLVDKIENIVEAHSLDPKALGEIEEFPAEGTRELYIGQQRQSGKLLLMQAIGPGPYQEALHKRGAGLHHIAIDVTDVKAFVAHLPGSGWYLHPRSLGFFQSIKQVWLTRPGVPVLIEVNQRKKLALDDDHFIEQITFPFPSGRLCEALGCARVSCGEEFRMMIGGRDLSGLKG